MTAILVSKRGTITLPPDMRRKLGLDAAVHPMMLVELRDGGVFLQPAEALPLSDIPKAGRSGRQSAVGAWEIYGSGSMES